VAKWERLGLIGKEGSAVKRLFSLQDFGLEVPVAKEGVPAKGATDAKREESSTD
jgi:hypothetical protein